MECSKKETCVNHEVECYRCAAMADMYTPYPCYKALVSTDGFRRVKFQIFFGSQIKGGAADDLLNEWLSEHPSVVILDMKYQQARYGDHSICIMYREE